MISRCQSLAQRLWSMGVGLLLPLGLSATALVPFSALATPGGPTASAVQLALFTGFDFAKFWWDATQIPAVSRQTCAVTVKR